MIPRKEIENLVGQADKHTLSILLGSRQVGKSTLLGMIQGQLGLPADVFNLENPLHLALFNEGYTSFIRQVRHRIVFIDEFQYCSDISSVFKAIYDLNPEIKVYASGSSSLEIQAHLKESLAGRKRETIIYPLSFAEWLMGTDPALAVLPQAAATTRIDDLASYRNSLDAFLRFGAMPGIVDMTDEIEKREYLAGIYRTYIAKDIKSFLNDESVLSFNKMISWLALNNGSQLNKNTLATVAGVSARQIDRYIDVLQGTYVLALVPPLSTNKGKELVRTNKYYLYDQGVINAIVQDFRPVSLRPDAGMIREAFVFWELRKTIDIRYSIRYWRTADGKEVDFVLERDRVLLPVEVKSGWKTGKIPPGIKQFFSYYPETRAAVVLYDGAESIAEHEGRRIYFEPLFKASRIPALLEQSPDFPVSIL